MKNVQPVLGIEPGTIYQQSGTLTIRQSVMNFSFINNVLNFYHHERQRNKKDNHHNSKRIRIGVEEINGPVRGRDSHLGHSH